MVRFFPAIVLFLLLSAGIYSCKETKIDPDKGGSPVTETDTLRNDSMHVFNVPMLLDMNVSSIRKLLGKPRTHFQPTEEQKLMKLLPVIEYKSGTTFIYIEYDSTSVEKIFISDNFKERTVEEIMHLGKIELDHPHYLVKVSEWKKRDNITNAADTVVIAGIEVIRKQE